MDIDLLAEGFYGAAARRAHAWMRDNQPIYRDERNGLWGVATYSLVAEVEREPQTFSSAGGTRPKAFPLPWMIDMDGAAHRTRRKLVSPGFTPARMRAAESWVRSICDDLIDRVCERGSCDLVHDLAAPLPLIVIADLLGVRPEDRDQLLTWTDDLIGAIAGTPDRVEAAAEAFAAYDAYARNVIAARRIEPADDLISVLVHAEVDGDRLTDDELVFETLLILIGGDETTRHVVTGGIDQVLRDASAWEQLLADRRRVPAAVEEMLRWVSPIKNMARTLTRNAELAGTVLREGDDLVVLYESANFDPVQFEDPEAFLIDRSPNDHLAFGFGPHFCLGASLARTEVRVMLDRLLCRLPDLALADPALVPPTFLGAITELPVTFSCSPEADRVRG